MQIRFRIFLWVFLLFAVFIISIFILSDIEIENQLSQARSDIEKEVIALNQKERANLLTFIGLEITNFHEKISSLFNSIGQMGSLQSLYIPNAINLETKTWGNAATLIATHTWLDYVQITMNEKESSYIVSEPPYVTDILRVPVTDMLSIFIDLDNSKSHYQTYVGVPYWSNEIIFRREKHLTYNNLNLLPRNNDWLIFSIEDFKAIDTQTLKPKHLSIEAYPENLPLIINSPQEMDKLVQTTIEMIELVQQELKKYPNVATDIKKSKKIRRLIDSSSSFNDRIDREIEHFCQGDLCDILEERINKQHWGKLKYWQEQSEQIRLIWELATITGAGLWNFDPFSPSAPKGIVSVPWQKIEDYLNHKPSIGACVKTNAAFKKSPLPVKRNCRYQPIDKTNLSLCANPDFRVLSSSSLNSVFLTGSIFFDLIKPPQKRAETSTLTVGISLDDMLYKLAIASPNNIMMITNSGIVRLYTPKGDIKDLSQRFPFNVSAAIEQKTGKIEDVEGNEYYFIHLASVARENGKSDGHVLVIERRNGQYAMMSKIRTYAHELMRTISIETALIALVSFVIILIILNQVIKNITKPLHRLAKNAAQVGAGHLDEVKISKKNQARKDEIGSLCFAFARMIDEIKKGEEVRSLLDKVVSKEVAEKILSEGVKLGGEIRDVTIMFSDIRNFTQITEHMDPKEVLDMLNDCLTILSRVIDDFSGIIDKYEGDEIMALFGAPLDMENHSLVAILCAVEMREVLRVWNIQREQAGKCKLEIGTGIHSGQSIAGNVGAENHLSYTVLGHNVNLASRICNHAEGMEILITEDVLNTPLVKEKINCEPLDPVRFKGVSQPVQLYRVVSKKI